MRQILSGHIIGNILQVSAGGGKAAGFKDHLNVLPADRRLLKASDASSGLQVVQIDRRIQLIVQIPQFHNFRHIIPQKFNRIHRANGNAVAALHAIFPLGCCLVIDQFNFTGETVLHTFSAADAFVWMNLNHSFASFLSVRVVCLSAEPHLI